MGSRARELTNRQRELLSLWFPGASVVRDHSWAYQVGEEAFERQGHRMIAEAMTA